ncbi:MAG: MBL fold metallo-hydrolase [Candidatus Binatia bacterium]
MRIRFWGTRGSLPMATEGAVIRDKIKRALLKAAGRQFADEAALDRFIDTDLEFPLRSGYGGNTSSVEVIGGDHYTLCDMGSGLRCFGQRVLAQHESARPQVYNFFMSHVHWDHIMGFPFFPPAYISGNTIRIHGGHSLAVLEEAFRRQQSDPCFPVHWHQLRASISFVPLEADRWYEIDGLRVRAKLQPHPGDSYGYRFEKNGRSMVYSTDGEHKLKSEEETAAMVEFYRDADLVVFDSMYSFNEMIDAKADWGHSSNIVGVDLCLRAKVKHYCMFHHEPSYSDDTIYSVLGETQRYAEIAGENNSLHVSTAYDGLVIDL